MNSTGTLCTDLVEREKRYGRKYQPDTLNILRVLATLMVFCCHGSVYIAGIYDETNILSFLVSTPAWAGVWVFLFLGGYLFAYGAERGRYPFKDKLKPMDVLRFYWHRILRLAPIYYCYVLFFEFFTDHNFLWNNPIVLLRILTFTYTGDTSIDGIGHLWYISLSMWMYIIMPFIYYLLSKIDNKYALLNLFFACLFGGLALRLVRDNLTYYTGVYTNFFCNLDFTICGILMAMLKKRLPSRIQSMALRIFIKALAALAFAGLVIYNSWIYFYYETGNNLYVYSYILPTAYIASVSGLIIAFHGDEPRIRKDGRISSLRATIWSGINSFSNCSYGFYVFHMATFMWLSRTIQTMEWYVNASFYTRYFLFFIPAFIVTIIVSLLFAHGTDWSPKKSKKARSTG